jgi:DNA (cytosine-5)-methyltransferase 1
MKDNENVTKQSGGFALTSIDLLCRRSGSPRALDLFCKAGGVSVGLARAGFDVTGVDIEPQPRYPFKFICADALDVDLAGYDFIWASPPCQKYSSLKSLTTKEYADLIEPIRAKLKAAGKPYIIENVEGAPLENPITLCGTMFGLRVYRHRLFESNIKLNQPMHPLHLQKTVNCGRKPKPGDFVSVAGNVSDVKYCGRAMGITWMNQAEIGEAIPPAYSEYLAHQVIDFFELQNFKQRAA